MRHIYKYLGSDESIKALWQNREALEKYLERLKELMMENNLELHKQITFDDLVNHGLESGANVVNGMPWDWKINGKSVTHENDNVYIIETIEGMKHFHRGEILVAYERGLMILVDHGDTHAPGGCPM